MALRHYLGSHAILHYILDLIGSAQFVPHAVCLLWRPDLLLMHGVSDFLIFLAYVAIPFIILRAVRARPDLMDPGVARLFASFIGICALSHLSSLVTLWVPAYGIQGVIKMLTAGVSIYTVVQLAKLLPAFITLPSRQEMAMKEAEIAIEKQSVITANQARDKLSEFAYIASHDLKAPMRGLSNQARFLLEDHGADLPPDARRRLDRMQELCGQLEKLTSTLLKYSRLGGSDVSEDVDPKVLVNGIKDSLLEMLEERNAEIVIETHLPKVRGNPSDMRTVLQNLIVNGIFYNDSDRKIITVGFKETIVVKGVTLKDVFFVRDNGIGIDGEFHTDVFRMFKRLNSPGKYDTGSGAGLAFVKKVIDGNGGRITLDSSPGAGSTFYFAFYKTAPPAKAPEGIGAGLPKNA